MRRGRPALVLVVSLLVSALVPRPAAGGAGGVEPDGTVDLDIHFRFPPAQIDIDRVRSQTQRASQLFCDATEGQMRFGRVRLTAGGAAEPAGDVWYYPPGVIARSSNAGRIGGASSRVTLAHGDIRSDVLVHELSHHIFRLKDQYDEQRIGGSACGQGPSIDFGQTERNHTLMQQSDVQRCRTGAGVRTGRRCIDAADCNAGESCPPPLLMSEFTVEGNFDPLRGDNALPDDTCPAPRPGDTVHVGGFVGQDQTDASAFDATSFATAQATAEASHALDFIDADGDVPGYDEGSAHSVWVFADHTGPDTWSIHLGLDGKHFAGGTAGALVLVGRCDLEMEARWSFTTGGFNYRRAQTVNGFLLPIERACEITLQDFANGAPDAELEVRFDDFWEREADANASLRRTSFSDGTKILADGEQQLGACPETEACDQLWNEGTQRWEATNETRRALQDGRTPQDDWDKIVANADEFFGLDLVQPADLPLADAPAACLAAVEFEEDVAGADQVFLVIDRSGSMRADREFANDTRTRLDWAKAGARGFAKLQEDTTTAVGLISFDEDPTLELDLAPIANDPPPPLPAGSRAIADVRDAIDALAVGGDTAIGDALALARDELAGLAGGTQAVLLLSDGENRQGQDPEAVAQELRDAGVLVYSMSVGDAADGEMLARIADETGGESYDAPTALELPTVFATLYARVRGEAPIVDRRPGLVDASQPRPDFIIPVEPGATRLNVMLSNANDSAESWSPGFELRHPGGAVVMTHTHPAVIRDSYFRLLRVGAPAPGDWRLRVFSINDEAQHFRLWAHAENSAPDCWASALPAVVTDPASGVAIGATSSLGGPVGRGVDYTATITTPGGAQVELPLALDDELAGSGRFDAFAGRGRYDVLVRCAIGAQARFTPGEHADEESVIAQGQPHPFVREARTHFFLDAGGPSQLPPGSDCDGDGFSNAAEGGPTADLDRDGRPNACDSDADGDDVPDRQDGGGDLDHDGAPDCLDADRDGDGAFDGGDNCPTLKNSAQTDVDGDGVGDACDNCLRAGNGPARPDAGGASQRDTNLDGYGNVCDPDFSDDGMVNFTDLALLRRVFFTTRDDMDLNGDGLVNFTDLALFKTYLFKTAGPSGLACAGSVPCSAP